MAIPRFFPDGTYGDAKNQAPQINGDIAMFKEKPEINDAGYYVQDYGTHMKTQLDNNFTTLQTYKI